MMIKFRKTRKTLIAVLLALLAACACALTLTACGSKKTLDKIEILTPPLKVEYVEGEKFNSAGMVVIAYYSDESEAVITNYTLRPDADTELDSTYTKVTVFYTEDEITKSADVAITVTEKQTEVPVKYITGAVVSKLPKIQYKEGETFSVDGMEWTVAYSDLSTETVKFTDETEGVSFTPSGALKPSDTQVSITYKGYTLLTPIPITVQAKVEEIPPSPDATIVDHEILENCKTEYFDGEEFDVTGLEVNFFYSDGGNKVVEFTKSTQGAVYPESPLHCNNNKLTELSLPITYQGYRFNVSVTVRQPEIVSVTIVTPPDKLKYCAGERFDPAGMTVKVRWEDGYETPYSIAISEYNSQFSNSPLTVSDTEISVYYVDPWSDTVGLVKVQITVVDIQNAEIVSQPAKTQYIAGESFDPAGMVIKVTYRGGDTENVTLVRGMEGLTLPENALTASDTSVTVYYYNYPIETDIEILKGVYIEAEDARINSSSFQTPDGAVDKNGVPNASGGRYVSDLNAGDSIVFSFYSDKAGKGDLAFILASKYLKKDYQWSPVEMGDCQFNLICEFSVNGVQYDIPDSVILPGGKAGTNAGAAWLWYNWKEVVFENIDFAQGRNEVILEFIPHNINDCSQPSFNGTFTANVDSLKVTSEECELEPYSYNYQIIEANITSDEDNVLLVLSGDISYLNYTEEELAEVLKNSVKTGLRLRSLEAIRELKNYSATVKGDTFTVYAYLSDIKFAGEYFITVNGENLKISDTSEYMYVNHYRYSLYDYDEYALINIYQEDEFEIEEITNAYIIEGPDGEVLYCLTGRVDASGYTEDEIKAELANEYFDLQENEYAQSGNWDGRWNNIQFKAMEVVLGEDGEFTIKYDISGLEDFCYTMHFQMGYNWDNDADDFIWKPSDVKPDFSINRTVTIGGRRYTLICVPGSNNGEDYWGCIGLKIVTVNS